MFKSALMRTAAKDSTKSSIHDHRSNSSWTANDLIEIADHIESKLTQQGVTEGDRIVIAQDNPILTACSIIASSSIGAIGIISPSSASRRPVDQDRIDNIIHDARPSIALVESEAVQGLPTVYVSSHELQSNVQERSIQPHKERHHNQNDPILIQYSSGTQGRPKGVVLTKGKLESMAKQSKLAYKESMNDIAVTWVPLYHDMGLITGLIRPLLNGYTSVIMPTSSFATDPLSWLRTINSHRATLSSAPNFAYEMCLRRATVSEIDTMDLSSWRVARNAGEPVLAKTIREFTRKFKRAQFQPEAMSPSYGLAEATLTVTSSMPEARPTVRTFDKIALAKGNPVPRNCNDDCSTIDLVSSGSPMPHTKIQIVDVSGNPTSGLGRIRVNGPQIAHHYWPNSKLKNDGWLSTPDLGFIFEDELYILDRSDHALRLRGQIVSQQELTSALNRIDGINPGTVFGFELGGSCVVAAELREQSSTDDMTKLVRKMSVSVARAIGVRPAKVLLLKKGQVSRTSSGKINVADSIHEAKQHLNLNDASQPNKT